MSNGTNPTIAVQHLLETFRTRKKWWITPTVIGGLLGIAVAVLKPQVWEAHQAIIVRDSANSDDHSRPGKFANTSDMKTLLETILELAKSKSVLHATLETVGPAKGKATPGWVTDKLIEDFRKKISISPPGGAEFGKTEVAYISVESPSRERSLELVEVLSDQLDLKLRELRDARAQSMAEELSKAERLAENSLEAITEKLKTFESETGSDLSELRMLYTSSSSSSDLRQNLIASENRLREIEQKKRETKALLSTLHSIAENTEQPIPTPKTLTQLLPTLARLNDGLVDAQLKKSQLLGAHTSEHPKVQSAALVESNIRDRLVGELATSIQSLELDLKLHEINVVAISESIHEDKQRLRRIAGRRAEYANLLSASDSRTKLLEVASKNLSETRGSQASARAASLIQKMDQPEAGIYPSGPRRSIIAAAGWIGGFVIGVSILLVFSDDQTPVQPLAETHAGTQFTQGAVPDAEDFKWELPRDIKLPSKREEVPTQNVEVTEVATPTPPVVPQIETLASEPEPMNASTKREEFGLHSGSTLRKALEQMTKQEANS